MSFTYSIDNNQVVNIFTESQALPVIIQPNWPNGMPWSSIEEAETWAQLCIDSITNPEAPYAPAGPGLQGQPKNQTGV